MIEQQIMTKINEEDIKKFYDFLNHEKETELRFILKEEKTIQLWVNNYEDFLNKIKQYNGKYNIFVGINERTTKGDKDEHVKVITHVVHDIDAHNGTPESFLKAQEITFKIKKDLIEQGHNEPLITCSGRGFWIIHNVKIENIKETVKKIKIFGEQIEKNYKTEGIEFDSSVYNPSRVVRVPGTININHPDKVLSYIINIPNHNIDEKLTEKILNIEIPTYTHSQLNINSNPSLNSFMDYCLTHEIPKGERHKIISRHIAHYISDHPDRELLKEQYIKIQKGSEGELDQWLKKIDEEGKNSIIFSIGQLVNFTKKYKIPFEWKNIPEYIQWKKEQRAEIKLKNVIENENKEEKLNKEGQYLFQAIGDFSDFLEIARRFCEKQPIYYDNSKIWWIWNNLEKKWEIIDEIDVMNEIDKRTINPAGSLKFKQTILEALKRIGRLNKPKDIKKTWIQFKDKIIDLETDEEFEATPKYFVTNPIFYKLGKDDKTPKIDKIFNEWVGEKFVQTLYEIIAYCMMPDYPLHRFFILKGSGLNGKSKYHELIKKTIGESNCCSAELEEIIGRFGTARLYKKLVCFMGETNINEMRNTSKLKRATGGDLINFEYKGKDSFDNINYAKLIINSNSPPETTDKTLGFYRRTLIIDFPNQFTEKKDILNDIPEEEYENLTFKCLKYLKVLLQKREFHNEGTIEERTKKYEDSSNPIKKFISEFCDISNPDNFIAKYQFEKQLNDWLKTTGHRSLSSIEISKKVKIEGFEDGKKSVDWFEGEGLKQVRVWFGIKFKE